MKLFFTKSHGAYKYVFSVKIGNEAAYACQECEVRIARKNSSYNSSKKNVAAKIQT
jgi:hypothetical protein